MTHTTTTPSAIRQWPIGKVQEGDLTPEGPVLMTDTRRRYYLTPAGRFYIGDGELVTVFGRLSPEALTIISEDTTHRGAGA